MHNILYVTWYTRLAKGGHDVDAKKWHPTHEEHSHDYSYGDGCLVVGHVVRRRLYMGLDSRPDTFAIVRQLDSAGYGSDGLYVFLCVAI